MKVLHIASSHGGQSVAFNADHYFAAANTALVENSTEAHSQITYRKAGTISNLRTYLSSNATSGKAGSQLHLHINGSSQISITIPANSTGWFEATGTATVADGDEVNTRFWNRSNNSNAVIHVISTVFDTGGPAVMRFGAINFANGAQLSGRYPALSDNFASMAGTTESAAQYTWPARGTFKNLQVNLSANSGGSDDRLRKNGANGNLYVNTPTAGTGIFEDTSNADAVADGDEVNFSHAQGTSGASSVTVEVVSVEYHPSEVAVALVHGSTISVPGAASGFSYALPGGSGNAFPATNAGALHLIHQARHLTRFFVNVTGNTVPGGGTAKGDVLVTGAQASGSEIDFTPGGTGLFETNCDQAYLSTDTMAFRWTATGGGESKGTGDLLAK